MSSKISWVIPSQLNQCIHGTISEFAQNCTKCAPVGAVKNPKLQIKIPRSLAFMAF